MQQLWLITLYFNQLQVVNKKKDVKFEITIVPLDVLLILQDQYTWNDQPTH